MDYIFNKDTNTYQIKAFDKASADCDKFIEENALLNLTILGDEDLKAVRKSRTIINAKLEEIKNSRLQINKVIMGDFNTQSKELEDKLDKVSKALTAKINEYSKPAVVEAKPKQKVFVFAVKSTSKEALKEFEKLAKSKGFEYTLEER